jgi:hypothetical protein
MSELSFLFNVLLVKLVKSLGTCLVQGIIKRNTGKFFFLHTGVNKKYEMCNLKHSRVSDDDPLAGRAVGRAHLLYLEKPEKTFEVVR